MILKFRALRPAVLLVLFINANRGGQGKTPMVAKRSKKRPAWTACRIGLRNDRVNQ
jgi:hypothetical protein